MSEQPQIYPVETLSPNDFEQWINHCGGIFPVGPDYFRRHFVCDPNRDYNSVFIIKNDEGKIISTVRVFHRQVYIGGKIYKMGGVGEVSTNENYRRLGLSYKLMEAASNYMKKNDFDLSILGTGYFSHYVKHGFMQVNAYVKTISDNFTSKPADIRPLTPENFREMSVLYDKYCLNLNCCIVRLKEYWKSWCAAEIKNPRGLFKDGRLTGYICFNDNNVTEIAADENDYDALLSVVKPENGKINLPKFIKTSGEVISEECKDGKMICVYKPVEIGNKGIVLSDTASVVKYLNDNGGIIIWGQDEF